MPFLQGALICDAATSDSSGKVSILGGFVSAVLVPSTPWPAPISFAGRIGINHDEATQEHNVVIKITGPSGGTVGEATAIIEPQDPSQLLIPDVAGGVNLVLPLPFPVNEGGMHSVSMTVDGILLVELPLVVFVGSPPGQ